MAFSDLIVINNLGIVILKLFQLYTGIKQTALNINIIKNQDFTHERREIYRQKSNKLS